MKKAILLIASFAATFAITSHAARSIGGSAYSDDIIAADNAVSNALAAADTTVSNALVAQLTAQIDTNNVTTNTLYTPRHTGDLLVGKLHASTQAVWISVGVLTSDWKQVFP